MCRFKGNKNQCLKMTNYVILLERLGFLQRLLVQQQFFNSEEQIEKQYSVTLEEPSRV